MQLDNNHHAMEENKMIEKTRMLGKRLLSIMLSVSAAVSQMPLVSQSARPVLAAETQSADNILEALGMDTKALNGFDASDTTSNPFGKKVNRMSGSDEVLIGSPNWENTKDGFLIGQNSSVGQVYRTWDDNRKEHDLFSYQSGWINDRGVYSKGSDIAYISDLALFDGSSAGAHAANAGYQLFSENLNVGGKTSIYLGVKRSTNPEDAITEIKLLVTDSPPASFTEGEKDYKKQFERAKYNLEGNSADFKKSEGDTNYSHGGDYVYIYFTKDYPSVSAGSVRPVIRYLRIDGNASGSVSNVNLNDSSAPCYLHAYTEQTVNLKAEGESVPLPESMKNDPFVSKTASGFFDLREDGKKTQYAMVRYNTILNELDLGVYDALNPDTESTVMQLGWYDPYEMSVPHNDFGREINYDPKLNSLYATTVINVKTADFNNDGIDEILIYNPKVESGEAQNGAVEVYMRTNEPGTTCYQFGSASSAWIKVYSTSLPLGSVPSLNTGDINNDGYADFLISYEGKTQAVFGGRVPFTSIPTCTFESKYTVSEVPVYPGPDGQPRESENIMTDTCAVVFAKETAGAGGTKGVKPYVAVMGYQGFLMEDLDGNSRLVRGKNVVMLYAYDSIRNSFTEVANTAFDASYRYALRVTPVDWTSASGSESQYFYLYHPMDLHVMNGKLFSQWLYETHNVIDMDLSEGTIVLNKKDSDVNREDKILTGGFSLSDMTFSYDAYCFDYQTAVLNSNDASKGGTTQTDSGDETTFFQYVRVSLNQLYGGNYGIGAYTGGNVKGATKPEMSPYAVSQSLNPYPMMYAVMDMDDDSSSTMSYTGKHWYQYSDPEILAVLSAPPYFKDLASIDSDYADAATGFGKSESSSEGITESFSMEFGGYVKFTPKIKIFGIELAGIESELHSLSTFSEEYSNVNTTSFEITYQTSGTDAVVFYSIPVECYEYEYTVTQNGKKESAKGIMYVPHQPSHSIKTLNEYRALCERYSDMPKIADDVVRHTVGEPSTYPKSSAGYSKPTEHKHLMNIDSNTDEGRMAFGQSIAFDTETSYNYSGGMRLSWLAGITSDVGGGGLEGGFSIDAGTVSTDCTGMSFFCDLKKLPVGAADKGYSMTCKMFVHESSYTNMNGDVAVFPVIDYLVPESSEPPHIPTNLKQDYENSTMNSVVLTWEYDAEATDVDYFTVSRMTKLQGQSEADAVPIGMVSFGESIETANGKKLFRYVDTGRNLESSGIDLAPNMGYSYVVEANRGLYTLGANTSIQTAELTAYTHSADRHPTVTLEGVFQNAIQMYPDIEHTVTAVVGSTGDTATSISYIWQKRNTTTGNWDNLNDYKTKSLPLHQLIANEKRLNDAVGEYRCKVSIQTASNENAIAVYSDSFIMTEKQRNAKPAAMTAAAKDHILKGSISIMPDDENSDSNSKSLKTPTGTVMFKLTRGNETFISRSVSLEKQSGRTGIASFEESTAVTDAQGNVTDKFSGIYQLTASYSGDRYFAPFETEPVFVLFGKDEIYPITYRITEEKNALGETEEIKQMTDSFSYGETMQVEFHKMETDENGILTDTFIEDIPVVRKTITAYPQEEAYSESASLGALATEENPRISYSYFVVPTNITVGVSIPKLYLDNLDTQKPQLVVLSGELLSDSSGEQDTPEKLITLKYQNTGGSTVSEITQSDTYTTVLGVNQDNERAAYYHFTFVNQTFRVEATRLNMTLMAAENGRVDVLADGTYNDVSEEQVFKVSSGTEVQLTAKPEIGYRLKNWVIDDKNLELSFGTLTSNTIKFTMISKNVTVSAVFEEQTGQVLLDHSFILSGNVIVPEGFSNDKKYGVGQKLTFEMQGSADCEPDFWAVDNGTNAFFKRIKDTSITVEVTGEPITLYPIFVGAPCTLTYPAELTAKCIHVNRYDDWLNPIVPSGETIPKGSKISVSPVSAQAAESEIWVLNGEVIDFSKGAYEFVIDGDTVIQRKSDFTTTTEETTTSNTTTSNTTTGTTVNTTTVTNTTTDTEAMNTTTVNTTTGSTTTNSTTISSDTTSNPAANTTAAGIGSTSEATASAETTAVMPETDITDSTTVSSEKAADTTTSTVVSERIPGDANRDGSVSLKDVVLIRRVIAGGWNAENYSETAADVNGDGTVNLKDVVIIRRYIAGGWNVTMQ